MEHKSLIGKTILGYEVVAQVGVGSFGTVYKVIKSNALGDYTRALKHIALPSEKHYLSVLNSMGGDIKKADAYFQEMLQDLADEIALLSSLSEKRNAHIIRYYESDLETYTDPLHYDIYILMEYATPLVDYLTQHPGFTVQDVVEVGLDVLKGIQVCHENDVIHRDVKEDNIFVSADGAYELGDFGVSKILRDSSRAESLKGTPNYLAPEVYLNQSGYSKSVDLYALGIVLYRLLNHGRNPFMPPYPEPYLAKDEDEAFEKRMRGQEVPPPALGSVAIQEVLQKALASEDSRYQDTESFTADLEAALVESSSAELNEEIGYKSPKVSFADVTVGLVDESQQTLKVGIGSKDAKTGSEEANDSAKTVSADTIICSYCHTVNKASDNYCKMCGQPLLEETDDDITKNLVRNGGAKFSPPRGNVPLDPLEVTKKLSEGTTSSRNLERSSSLSTPKIIAISLVSVCSVLVAAVAAFVIFNPLNLTEGPWFENSKAAFEQRAIESQKAAEDSQAQTQDAQEAAKDAQGEASEAQSQVEELKKENEELQQQAKEAEQAQAQAEREAQQQADAAERARQEAAARANANESSSSTSSSTRGSTSSSNTSSSDSGSSDSDPSTIEYVHHLKSSPSGMLSDSDSREYSRSELEELSDWDLYVARNEIFARYGRMFVEPDLDAYFRDQPWYVALYDHTEFDENPIENYLNSYEYHNALLMRDIEQERGSEYL